MISVNVGSRAYAYLVKKNSKAMDHNKQHIFELHADHKEWINRLAFYKDEVDFLERRLLEVAGKYTNAEILAACDSLANRLTIQRSEMHRLKEAIKGKEELLEHSAIENPTAIDRRLFPPEVRERQAMENFEDIYHDLRKELIVFFGKYM